MTQAAKPKRPLRPWQAASVARLLPRPSREVSERRIGLPRGVTRAYWIRKRADRRDRTIRQLFNFGMEGGAFTRRETPRDLARLLSWAVPVPLIYRVALALGVIGREPSLVPSSKRSWSSAQHAQGQLRGDQDERLQRVQERVRQLARSGKFNRWRSIALCQRSIALCHLYTGGGLSDRPVFFEIAWELSQRELSFPD